MSNTNNTWENEYKANRQMSLWPWTDLVSLCYRYTDIKQKRNNFKVLELGCGSGANISFFQSLGVEYYSMDGSETIVKMLKNKFPIYANNIFHGDFTKDIPFEEKFDLIFDRAAMTHNHSCLIKNTIKLITPRLKDNAPFIGVHWFGTSHSSFAGGEITDCKYSYKNVNKGPLAGLGDVHFANEEVLKEYFQNFDLNFLQHSVSEEFLPGYSKSAIWNFVANKK
jgi:SAM-dependent methyltransferase